MIVQLRVRHRSKALLHSREVGIETTLPAGALVMTDPHKAR